MASSVADPPPIDTGNQLLAETPANLETALLDTSAGQRFGLTIRTASTTLTVMLTKADAALWAKLINETVARMSGSGLIVTGA